MFLLKNKKITKTKHCFLKTKKRSNFLFLGKSYFLGYNILKNKAVSFFKNPVSFSPINTNSVFSLKKKGIFSFFKEKLNFSFIFLYKSFSVFSSLISFFNNKKTYNSAFGTYIIFKNFDSKTGNLNFILPSGKTLITSILTLGLKGINPFRYKKNEFKFFYKNGFKKKVVKGVCMNPVDHHNGGRSNRKPLFLNKYNSVAKNGK
jgi:hypothetical protein